MFGRIVTGVCPHEAGCTEKIFIKKIIHVEIIFLLVMPHAPDDTPVLLWHMYVYVTVKRYL